MTRLSKIGEFGLITTLKKSLQKRHAIVGIGDDTAVLPLGRGDYQLLTTDMLIEGVHFRTQTPPKKIGHKTLACSISDMASMGGIPRFAVVSLGTSRSKSVNAIKEIYKGLSALAKKHNIDIVGGDTVLANKLTINVALLGTVKKKYLTLRSKAKMGDRIFVTGSLGNSFKSGKHLNFTPRIAESQFLIKSVKPTSMIDISDGFVADLKHILDESKVGAVIDESAIPVNKGATLKNALYDGEDFELLFTVNKSNAEKLKRIRRFRFTEVGKIVEKKKGLKSINTHGKIKRIAIKGYRHF